jgi:hypothetical protein
MSHPKHDQARSFLSIAEDQLGKVLILRYENSLFYDGTLKNQPVCVTWCRFCNVFHIMSSEAKKLDSPGVAVLISQKAHYLTHPKVLAVWSARPDE